MSKLILNGAGLTSTVSIGPNIQGVGNIMFQAAAATLTTPSVNVNLINPNNIEIHNGHILDVTSNIMPLPNLIIVAGTVSFCNQYVGTDKTNIEIQDNNTLTITDKELPIGNLELHSNVTFKFIHNGINLQIQTPEALTKSLVQDMDRLYDLCDFLYAKFNNSNPLIALEEVQGLREYQNSKEILNLFVLQNVIPINLSFVDFIIQNNFWEYNGIAHTLVGSALEILPVDVLGSILSYLNLDDVAL